MSPPRHDQLRCQTVAVVASLVACASCGSAARHASQGHGGASGSAADGTDQPDGFPTPLIDPHSRMGVIVSSVTAGDWQFLRQRPALAAQKFSLMASDPFSFYRGSLALFLHDWNEPNNLLSVTRFPAGGGRVFGLGDAHPENFGTLRTASGTFRVEPNDFDTADVLPYLWDVRRFAVGMCLAARASNENDVDARLRARAASRPIARATAAAYATVIQGLATGAARPVIESGMGNAVLEDLFARSRNDWDHQVELDELTYIDGRRLFIRGVPLPSQPLEVSRTLPPRARLEIARTVAGYRATLTDAPSNAFLVPLDAVQKLGVGIGSFPRVRALVLARGLSTGNGDDLLLEIKELPPQEGPSLPLPSAFPNPQARLLAALAAGWTAPGADPLWGAGTWLGLPVQLRTEAAGFKTVRVSRLDGALGEPEVIAALGAQLASLIARMHAAPIPGSTAPAMAIARAVASDPEGFADEQADLALHYCDQVEADWQLFQTALAIAGPTLNVPGDPVRSGSPELRVLNDPGADPAGAGDDRPAEPVIINELAATGAAEYVELLNLGDSPQQMGGFAVADSDSDGGPRFPATQLSPATVLAGGGRLVILGGYGSPAAGPQTECGAAVAPCYHASWDISASHGETIYLLDSDQVIIDQRIFPADPDASIQSWSRLPDGSGPFGPGTPSPNRPNVAP